MHYPRLVPRRIYSTDKVPSAEYIRLNGEGQASVADDTCLCGTAPHPPLTTIRWRDRARTLRLQVCHNRWGRAEPIDDGGLNSPPLAYNRHSPRYRFNLLEQQQLKPITPHLKSDGQITVLKPGKQPPRHKTVICPKDDGSAWVRPSLRPPLLKPMAAKGRRPFGYRRSLLSTDAPDANP